MISPARSRFEYLGWSVYCFQYVKLDPRVYCALAKRFTNGSWQWLSVDGSSLDDVEERIRRELDRRAGGPEKGPRVSP